MFSGYLYGQNCEYGTNLSFILDAGIFISP